MKKLLITAAMALTLSGCATIATPRRCDGALAAATTAEQIAAVLVNSGTVPAKAALLAEAIMLGKLAIGAVCAATAAAPPAAALEAEPVA